jgi:nitrate reductase assembly molybdenum cofactor insertion protein NarJ
MTAKANNIVVFPKARSRNPLQSMEEIIDHITENRREHISYLVDDISEYVIQRAELEGFHVTAEAHTKSTMLFIESMRAMLYSTARLDHPLHKITDDIIVVESDDREED